MSAGFLETRRVLWRRARDRSPATSAERCTAFGAEDRGTNSFCDTCFDSAHGRIALREQTDGDAELIYATEPAPGPDEAFYHLVGVKLPEPVMNALLGVAELRGVIALTRRTFAWEGTQIHLDAVEGLGDFIEIETSIEEPKTPAHAQAQLEEARHALAISKESLVQETYVELLRAHAPLVPEAR